MGANWVCLFAKLQKKLGIKTSIFSESNEFSAKNFCDQYFVGRFNNYQILESFMNSANFFTIETENIPLKILEKISSTKKFSLIQKL